ncbi:hypothetical protein K4K54_009666, partial [Colletotrichum sp. SAR 10_86]
MSSSKLTPNPGEKPIKNDNRTENWTPQDAAKGCVTKKIWAAIYAVELMEFQDPKMQSAWKAGVLYAYNWISNNKDDTWVSRRYVAHQALKVCAFSM